MGLRLILPIAVLLGVLTPGCTSTPPPHSCANTGVCIDYIMFPDFLDERGFCDAVSGSYSTTAGCPTGGRVGRCTQTSADGALVWRWNYYEPRTTLEARNECPPPSPDPDTVYEFEER